jgi:hypothetical protein
MEDKQMTFRLKISDADLERIVLNHLVLEGQIGERESKCFKGLARQGRSTFAEFHVGRTETKKKE